jgi:hypothetical protein
MFGEFLPAGYSHEPDALISCLRMCLQPRIDIVRYFPCSGQFQGCFYIFSFQPCLRMCLQNPDQLLLPRVCDQLSGCSGFMRGGFGWFDGFILPVPYAKKKW